MVLALAALATRAQANIGLIRAGVSRGMTSTQIQGLIRSTGQTGLRRRDLLEGIRHVQGRVQSGTRIQNTRRDRFPDPSRIEPARGRMLSNFSYDVRVGRQIFDGGKDVSKYITVRSDTNLRPQDILDEAEKALDAAPDGRHYQRVRADEPLVVIGARRKV